MKIDNSLKEDLEEKLHSLKNNMENIHQNISYIIDNEQYYKNQILPEIENIENKINEMLKMLRTANDNF